MSLIDMHCHVGTSIDGAVGTLKEIRKNMKQFHIEKTVLFATDEENRGKTYRVLNSKILRIASQNKKRIIPFVRVVSSKKQAAMRELERCIGLGVSGIKIKIEYSFLLKDQRSLLKIIAEKRHFPIIIHCAHQRLHNPYNWEPLIREFSQTNFVLAHGGKDLYKECARLVKKYPNAYVDTSTLSYNRSKHLFKVLGSKKIVFASDYPYSHPSIEIQKYRLIVKKDSDLRDIFYRNAEKLLGIKINE